MRESETGRRTRRPHFGHALASVEISFPQSLQLVSDMMGLTYFGSKGEVLNSH